MKPPDGTEVPTPEVSFFVVNQLLHNNLAKKAILVYNNRHIGLIFLLWKNRVEHMIIL